MPQISTVVFDKMSVFSGMKYPGRSEPIDEWNEKCSPSYQLHPKAIDSVKIWILDGEKKKYDEDFYDRTFAIQPADLDPYIFSIVFEMNRADPQVNLLAHALKKLTEQEPNFTVEKLIEFINLDGQTCGFVSQTCNALISRITFLYDNGILNNDKGLLLPDLCRPGGVAVIDISTLDRTIGTLVVNVVINKMMTERQRIHNLLENAKCRSVKIYIPLYFPTTHIIVDEAHNYFQENNIVVGTLVKEIRNIGLKLTAVSQSPDLTDDFFDNISHLFVGAMNQDKRINMVRKMLPYSEKHDTFLKQVKSLRRGCYLYYDMKKKTKIKVCIRPRLSLHTAQTEIEDESQYLLNAPVIHAPKPTPAPIPKYEFDPKSQSEPVQSEPPKEEKKAEELKVAPTPSTPSTRR
jgi:hypothetical protein